jgi:hypothetical protein
MRALNPFPREAEAVAMIAQFVENEMITNNPQVKNFSNSHKDSKNRDFERFFSA